MTRAAGRGEGHSHSPGRADLPDPLWQPNQPGQVPGKRSSVPHCERLDCRVIPHLRPAPFARIPTDRAWGQPPCISPADGSQRRATTLRVYCHLFEGTQEELSRQLDRLRAATAPDYDNVVPIREDARRKEQDVIACSMRTVGRAGTLLEFDYSVVNAHEGNEW